MPPVFAPIPRRRRFGEPSAAPLPTARPRFCADLPSLIAAQADARPILATGAAGAGSDIASVQDGRIVDMRGLDRLIHFDPAAGRLRAQAGLSLLHCLEFLVERGHFLPVVPAWSHTTLGGALATDAHGANHDAAGAFGAWVRSFELHRSDQPAQTLRPGDPSGLFEATIGGMGLTGAIAWVEMETRPVRSAMMDWEAESFGSLEALLGLFEASQDWPSRRAWLDSARPGRGRFERFRHSQSGPLEARRPQPMLTLAGPAPRFFSNGLVAAAFAGALQRRGAASRRRDYASVLFPYEDAVDGYARVFGRRGCASYQAVLAGPDRWTALGEALAAIKKVDDVLIVTSLCAFGEAAPIGLMSFAREGLCLTVRARAAGERIQALLATLDSIVVACGGAINPCADVRSPRTQVERAFQNLPRFVAACDPVFASDFKRRMGLA